MARIRTPTETIALADAEQERGRVARRVARTQTRVLIENEGVPVAAVISAKELDRLDRLDAEWERGFAILDEIGAAFRDVDPDEIEREAANALAEVRAEMRAERDAR